MAKIEGLHTALNSLILRAEDEKRMAIDVYSLVEEVKGIINTYAVSVEDAVNTILLGAAEVALHQNGYKSVVKGKGLFVNPDFIKKPEYFERLLNNAILSEAQKKHATEILLDSARRSGCDGQLSFDLDNPGYYYEDVTEDQLLEMLRADATGTND